MELPEAANDTSEQITSCEGCGKPIFDGDKYHHGSDVDLCEKCAPTWQDLADEPDSFTSFADGDPVTEREANKALCLHLARGGKRTDKMVS
jgi:hypothetical protein